MRKRRLIGALVLAAALTAMPAAGQGQEDPKIPIDPTQGFDPPAQPPKPKPPEVQPGPVPAPVLEIGAGRDHGAVVGTHDRRRDDDRQWGNTGDLLAQTSVGGDSSTQDEAAGFVPEGHIHQLG